MSLFPFIVLGLLNGSVIGIIAGLVTRGIAPGNNALRFRDTCFLGMLGSIAGNLVATVLNSQDGYLAAGPSSLLFSVVGAMLTIGAVTFALLQSRQAQSQQPRSYEFNERQF